MTALAAVRPPWVEAIIREHGEPALDCTEPIPLVDRVRQCWVWSIAGDNYNVAIDQTDMATRRWAAAAGSPGRRAELVGPDRPTDDEMRALTVLGWGDAP